MAWNDDVDKLAEDLVKASVRAIGGVVEAQADESRDLDGLKTEEEIADDIRDALDELFDNATSGSLMTSKSSARIFPFHQKPSEVPMDDPMREFVDGQGPSLSAVSGLMVVEDGFEMKFLFKNVGPFAEPYCSSRFPGGMTEGARDMRFRTYREGAARQMAKMLRNESILFMRSETFQQLSRARRSSE